MTKKNYDPTQALHHAHEIPIKPLENTLGFWGDLSCSGNSKDPLYTTSGFASTLSKKAIMYAQHTHETTHRLGKKYPRPP